MRWKLSHQERDEGDSRVVPVRPAGRYGNIATKMILRDWERRIYSCCGAHLVEGLLALHHFQHDCLVTTVDNGLKTSGE